MFFFISSRNSFSLVIHPAKCRIFSDSILCQNGFCFIENAPRIINGEINKNKFIFVSLKLKKATKFKFLTGKLMIGNYLSNLIIIPGQPGKWATM